MEQIRNFAENNLANLHIPTIQLTDILEIIIISFMVYSIMVFIKNTRAWSLLKGIIFIMVFLLVAALFEMNTIIWIATNAFSLAITALIVVLQPELRKALETLGTKNIISTFFSFDGNRSMEGLFSDHTIQEITKACVEMSKVKTGALIVVKQNDTMSEFEQTGIKVDAIVSSQLLINIFEHNTPLHDGAIIIEGNRIKAATCYLPLSDNMHLSKELGTRHRAGIGITEIADSLVIIVSEENGTISVAYSGQLFRGLGPEDIDRYLKKIQNKPSPDNKRKNILHKFRK
ncbi:MAG: diadenylate cyclase CdaA [Lachnospiraceae bacterium]